VVSKLPHCADQVNCGFSYRGINPFENVPQGPEVAILPMGVTKLSKVARPKTGPIFF
jgi:hypothetical protein